MRSLAMIQSILAGCLCAIMPCAASDAGAFEIQSSIDIIHSPDTTIESLHRLFAGYQLGSGLTVGQSIYSAASGDAGGAFFWGYEAVKNWPISEKLSFGLQAFAGGGGGASQVIGDGLMLRLGAGLELQVSERLAFQFGVSHISIDGGDEDATALSIGVTHRAFPSQAGVNLQSVNIRSSTLSFHDALTRSGISQPNLALIGAEFAFDAGQIGEWHLAADGAFSGGDGYMQVLAGARHRVSMGRVTGLFEGAFGYGGGGDVDTGGGALLRTGIGAGIPLADDVILELGIQRYWLLDVGATADAFTLSLTKLQGRGADGHKRPEGQDWAFFTGITQQFPNAGFRKDAAGSKGKPLMQETSIDLFVTDRVYLTGNAQTVLGGDAAGYAIGLLGAGLQHELSQRVSLGVEAVVGAAGGGGVSVGSGLIAGLRGEMDIQVTNGFYASIAVGQYRSVTDGGMAPLFVGLGLKVPLRTD
jgi:hypothetical protein